MKHVTFCAALFCGYILSAADGAYNTWHGHLSGSKTTADRSVMIGAGAGAEAKDLVRSTFLGAGAGARSQNLTGCVGIGFGALSKTNNLTDVTAINGHFYAGNGSIFIKANKNVSDTSAVIRYENGTLTLNANNIVTPSGIVVGGSAESVKGYDLYLSASGDDANDGLTSLSPKRTFDGCFSAAPSNGTRVCVYPGIYAPPSNDPALGAGIRPYIVETNSCEFIAIGGAEKTFIVGISTNDLGYADGYYHTLAFSRATQTFKGFTIRGVRAYCEAEEIDYQNSSPAVSNCRLYDCVFENSLTAATMGADSFVSLYCSNTVFRSIQLYTDNSTLGTVFRKCHFVDCSLTDITVPSSPFAAMYFYSCFFENTLVVLPGPMGARPPDSISDKAINSTFIWPDGCNLRVNPAYSENCYFCIGTGYTSTNGVRNAFAPSWTNTFLNAEYVPASLDCPAIRNDETRDAGWKNSGLSHLKKLYKPQQLYIADSATGSNYVIRVENGELRLSLEN